MSEIIRYGAYLPRPRAPLGEIQSFFGRPGRPRAKALATPALDEDTLTMAYEAGARAGRGAPAPGPHQPSPRRRPSGCRSSRDAGARARHPRRPPLDIGGGPAAPAGRPRDRRGPVGRPTASRSWWSRAITWSATRSASATCCRPAGRRRSWWGRAASRAWALRARAGREVYDVWRLGTEPEARYRLEVLFDSYGGVHPEALAALGGSPSGPPPTTPRWRRASPTPRPCAGWARPACRPSSCRATSFVGEIGNLGAASVGVALALGLDGPRRASTARARLRRGGGDRAGHRGDARRAGHGTAAQIPGEAIDVTTYYRWTRGRQAEPH